MSTDLQSSQQGRSQHSSAPVREIRELPDSGVRDKDRLMPLIAETVAEGSSVLIFCGGRTQSQSGAKLAAEMLGTLLRNDVQEEVQLRREALVQQLREALGQAGNANLEHLILSGTHSGL